MREGHRRCYFEECRSEFAGFGIPNAKELNDGFGRYRNSVDDNSLAKIDQMRRRITTNAIARTAKQRVERRDRAPLSIGSSDVENRISKLRIAQSIEKSGYALKTQPPGASRSSEKCFKRLSVRVVRIRCRA